jgi:hypothetical protein
MSPGPRENAIAAWVASKAKHSHLAMQRIVDFSSKLARSWLA